MVNETVSEQDHLFMLSIAWFDRTISVFHIDWEESANADRVCVRPGIDEELEFSYFIYMVNYTLTTMHKAIANMYTRASIQFWYVTFPRHIKC